MSYGYSPHVQELATERAQAREALRAARNAHDMGTGTFADVEAAREAYRAAAGAWWDARDSEWRAQLASERNKP